MEENRAIWPINEREQAEHWGEKCEEMGGESFVNSRQLQCKVGNKELRVDKKRGQAVLESDTERLGTVRDANYIEGDDKGLKVSKEMENSEQTLRLKSLTPETESRRTNFEDKLVKAPENMRPNR